MFPLSLQMHLAQLMFSITHCASLLFMQARSLVFWSHCRFVDGESYFDAVSDALESAEEEIFITGWW